MIHEAKTLKKHTPVTFCTLWRRNPFFGGGGGGISKNDGGHHAWSMRKNCQITLFRNLSK